MQQSLTQVADALQAAAAPTPTIGSLPSHPQSGTTLTSPTRALARASQVVPILGFWTFQQSLELVAWVKRGMEPKKSARRKLAEAYGASVAQEFGTSKNSTGVCFDDVAGVDHAVGMFKEVIAVMTGDERCAARLPPARCGTRVCPC